jgi:hypothetical protein
MDYEEDMNAANTNFYAPLSLGGIATGIPALLAIA